MRRALVVAAAVVTLTACGSASSSPAGSAGHSSQPAAPSAGPSAGQVVAKPAVTQLPARLLVGVGRSAVIQQGSVVTLAGGLILGDSTTDAVQQIDLASGRVTRLAALALPVHDTAGGLVGAGGLVIGGGNSQGEQSVVQRWTGSAWTVVGHLDSTRSDLSAATIGSVVYALGGYDSVTPAVTGVLSTTDGATWRSAGSLAVAVRYGAAAVAGGKVWIFGGEASGVEKDSVQVWDPQTGRGTVVTHLPMALGHMSAVAVGSKILLLGGRTDASSGAMTDRMWWFDPGTGTLTDAGRLPYPVADASVAYLNGSVYVLGGESPHPIDTILKIKVIQ